MWKLKCLNLGILSLGILVFKKKSLGLFWVCELAHSCSQQNTVIYWGKLSCKMFISHTPLIKGQKKNQQFGRAQLTLHILPWTQRTYSEASWATSGETTRVCVITSSAHIEHWLQFNEVKMPKKKKMWRRCPQSFLSREGNAEEQASASGYWERSLRLSVIVYYGSLAFAAFTCLNTTDTYISLSGDVRESV